MIFIPFGVSFLALAPEEIKVAKDRARMILGDPFENPKKRKQEDFVVDADGAENETGVPSSWFLEQARSKRIPHLRFGKYVRFKLKDVIEWAERAGRHRAKAAFSSKKL